MRINDFAFFVNRLRRARRGCVPYIEPPIVAALSIMTTGEV
jgi:hypothetical protein